jgi:hypothetical protein
MINETIQRICVPNEDTWIVIETDRQVYELRVGGYLSTPSIDPARYPRCEQFPSGITIKSAHTDGENLYIALSNGEYLVHGFHNISAEGETSALIRRNTSNEFLENYGEAFFDDPDIHELRTNSEGNSEGGE